MPKQTNVIETSRTGKESLNKPLILRPKRADNPLSHSRKAIYTISRAINKLKVKNQRTKTTLRLRKLLIVLALIKAMTSQVSQARSVCPGKRRVDWPKKTLAYAVETKANAKARIKIPTL